MAIAAVLQGTAMAKKRRSEEIKSKRKSTSKVRKPLREVDGVFFDREHLNSALTALNAAGFSKESMTAVLERHVGGRRVAITDLPPAGFTQADKRQLRTLATSMSGAIGALAALGVTIATGGAAVAAVAAAALVGGSTATGVHVVKTLQGFDGTDEDIILSVRVGSLAEEKSVAEIFEKHDAKQIWAQNRPYLC